MARDNYFAETPAPQGSEEWPLSDLVEIVRFRYWLKLNVMGRKMTRGQAYWFVVHAGLDR